MATPANVTLMYTIQDNRGFRSNLQINEFISDIEGSAETLGDIHTNSVAVGTALQAMTNAKVVKSGWGYSYDYAQEPSSETGVYELVIQKARLEGGDGAGGFMALQIPAPKDSLFLTAASENLIVVNPAATTLLALQAALAAAGFPTPRGGAPFAQFFGGQLVEGKPRRRRVLQGA